MTVQSGVFTIHSPDFWGDLRNLIKDVAKDNEKRKLVVQPQNGSEIIVANGIEVHCEYGILRLTCDEAVFAHIRDHILAEPAVAEAVGEPTPYTRVQCISVGVPQPPAPPPSRHRLYVNWLRLVPAVIAGAFLCVINVVGIVTIVQWLSR